MEYKIRFSSRDGKQLDSFLRALPTFVGFDEARVIYKYKEADSMGEMPSAEIRVEGDGLYLCDYGASKNLIGTLVTKFVSQFGRVQIEEYE